VDGSRARGGPCDEAALVDAAIAGDAQTFAVLYDRYLDRVYRHVYYWVGNRADAEDLTQQVFLQAWRAIGRYRRTGASFAAWLLTIAQNAARQHHRDRKVTEPLDIEPVAPPRGNDPEAEALMRHDRAAVRRAILRLKDDQRQVVMMRFVEHLDPPDVAAALGKTEVNVRVIQHRALQELRRLLAHQVEP
jgi:RNA polymerase sigma-70 factor (ECF subfamily)